VSSFHPGAGILYLISSVFKQYPREKRLFIHAFWWRQNVLKISYAQPPTIGQRSVYAKKGRRIGAPITNHKLGITNLSNIVPAPAGQRWIIS
jgi:hypothetical protein